MWFTKSPDQIAKELDVDLKKGLSSEEAAKRLETNGPNKLPEGKKQSLFSKFIAELKDFMIYILIFAAVLSYIMGDVAETIIIAAIIILNAAIGVFQENKAEQAMEALKKLTTPQSLVRRNGEVIEIKSEDLVVGDVVEIDAGRFIPADLRLVESSNLQIDESALTGESVPSEKYASFLTEAEELPLGDRANMAFMSTLATYGRGIGVVVENAIGSEIGKIAKSLEEEDTEMTPLQKRMDHLGKTLGILCVGVAVIMVVVGFLQNRPFADMLITAISLAVAAIPEGLPAIVAIVLSIGVTRMSKQNAIVKKLPAVETLGSVNIICSDKTGTLTQNKMTVVRTVTNSNTNVVDGGLDDVAADENELNLATSLILCSDATASKEKTTGDPTEIAFVAYGNRIGLQKEELENKYPRVSERPFDSDRKMMSTCNKEGDSYRIHTKGAVDNLLKICTHTMVGGKAVPLTQELKDMYYGQMDDLSNQALRVLGAATKSIDHVADPKEMESELTFLGMVGEIDPPRMEVKDSVAAAKMAGVKTIMITGDHKNTAVAIAKELGIASHISEALTGTEIDNMDDEEFEKNIYNWRVFARVSPEHKVKIVRAFKSHGNIVSMTGDGVNDAPSLKFADIGVAMGITGTDVSKGAADMILTDDNFTTIVHAIETGRNIYANIKKAVVFLLSCNLGEVIAIFISVLMGWPVPLVATQILWVNLITDSLPAISLGMDPGDPDVMSQKPRNPKESFFSGNAGLRALIGGTLIGLLTIIAFAQGLLEFDTINSIADFKNVAEHSYELTNARTMAFVVLAVSQLFYSLSMRSAEKTIFQVGFFTNKYLIGSIAVGIFLQLVVIEVPFLATAFRVHPLSLHDWGIVFGFSLIPFAVNEIIKVVTGGFGKKEHSSLE